MWLNVYTLVHVNLFMIGWKDTLDSSRIDIVIQLGQETTVTARHFQIVLHCVARLSFSLNRLGLHVPSSTDRRGFCYNTAMPMNIVPQTMFSRLDVSNFIYNLGVETLTYVVFEV